MQPCNLRWREALANHALGQPASAALAEHLASCAACSAALEDWKARMGKVDATIRQMVDAKAPAPLVAQVMAEVHADRQRVWMRGWQWRTAAVCLAVLVIVAFAYEWNLRGQRRKAEEALSAASAIGNWKSPTATLLRTPGDRWLKTPPRLGKYFYPLKTTAPEKERENP